MTSVLPEPVEPVVAITTTAAVTEAAPQGNFAGRGPALAAIYVLLGGLLLVGGRRNFPNLHTMLDTGALVLSSVLAWLFVDMGRRTHRLFLQTVGIAFAVTALAEFVHALVTVEWYGALEPIAREASVLRPSTWPPAAHLLPIGFGIALWSLFYPRLKIAIVAVAELLLGIGMALLFYWVPQYSAPTWFGITRPALIAVPVLWLVVGVSCWFRRRADRAVPPFLLAAAVLASGHLTMLYSRAPHDTQAMVAHLAKVSAYLIVLVSVMQMAAVDMLERLRAERALADLNAQLELRVRDRTAELQSANTALAAEVVERETAEGKARAQVERLNLLHRITRAIGEREDLASIYQIVLRTVEEQLGFDFGCVCDYDAAKAELTVLNTGIGSESLALDLALTEQAHIPIDPNGLSRCVSGLLVYEPDVAAVPMPFPARLTKAGLRSLVAAPLRVESRVFGVFIAARREPDAFSSGECEFLRQLTEHVALAAHQTQLHAALQRAYDDLRQTQQAIMQQERLRVLGQMASGIAHDINNAISPVALYAEALLEKETQLGPQSREYLETIQRAIDDVAQTVARLREFYRPRELDAPLAAVKLNDLVPQVKDLTRAKWHDIPQQRGVVIDCRTELASTLPDIQGSESEIREALINLVFNAVDAMPSGGVLLIRTSVGPANGAVTASGVRVEVVDTGVGMDDESRARCTEPFFTTKGERGTGLGLAMVHGVAQRHGADLEIQSAPGAGTTIRLIFPRPVDGSGTTWGVATAPTMPARMRVLVIDDDPLLLRSLRDVLTRDGHVVHTANGGQAGLDAFEAALTGDGPYEVVITDLGMPHVDGRRVANAIKLASPTTPVIMLTGWGQRLGAEGERVPHVDHLLGKPPKLGELRAALAAGRSNQNH